MRHCCSQINKVLLAYNKADVQGENIHVFCRQEVEGALNRLEEGCVVTARWIAPFTEALGSVYLNPCSI